jgi:hypothetical protein
MTLLLFRGEVAFAQFSGWTASSRGQTGTPLRSRDGLVRG